jgi:hypothetical protein
VPAASTKPKQGPHSSSKKQDAETQGLISEEEDEVEGEGEGNGKAGKNAKSKLNDIKWDANHNWTTQSSPT